MRLHWLEDALRSRYEQLDYIARDSPAAAVQLDERIERDTERLLTHPRLGRRGRKRGTRELVISHFPFIVVYRVKRSEIEVLRILHGAQRYPSKAD